MPEPIDSISHPNLVAFYRCDSVAGGVFVDELAGVNGVVSGATVTPGAIGNAVQFSADGHSIRVSSAIFNLSTFTLSFFIDTSEMGNKVIMEVGTNNYGWSLQMAGTGSFSGNTTPGCLSLATRGASSGIAAWKTSEVVAGTGVRHCMIVKDGTTAIKFYIDTLDRTGPGLGVAMLSPTFNDSALMIGQRYGGAAPYRGAVDHIKFFNIALAAADAVPLAEEASPYSVRGSVALDGVAYSGQVRIYRASDGVLIGSVSSDAAGIYERNLLVADPVYVMAVPESGYSPLIHGPITPTPRDM